MIRCLIVDDEPIAVRILQSHLARIPDVEVAAACTDSMEALRRIRTGSIDLIFLDIEMPALTGIGFVKALEQAPHFIFTTAHRDYALEGFELNAVDYLLKPISLPRLLRSLEKYRRIRRADRSGAADDSEGAAAGTLNLRVDRRTIRVDLAEIRYVESLSDYVNVHTEEQTYTSKLRISDLEDELAPHGFLRIHRSFIVSIAHVTAFTSSQVQVGTKLLPVSRTYRRQVQDRLGDGSE